jgi:hypothetical protein
MMQAWADHLDALRTGVRVRSAKSRSVRVRSEASPYGAA